MSRKQKKVNRTHHRRCSFEALENRRLLAGDVKVTLVGGKLSVTGDSADNAITITSAAVRVVAGSGTTINGGAGPFAIAGALTSLKVDMKGGNDTVTLGEKPLGTGLTVNGKASIKLGSGDDSFLVQNTTITGKLQINEAKGHDTVRQGTGNNIAKVKPSPVGTATITGAPNTPEGSVYTLNLSATLKNKKDVVTQWSINWDDGSAPQIVTGNPTTATHKYLVGNTTPIITATATVLKKSDKADFFQIDADLNLIVDNVPPTVALNAPGALNENGTLTLTGSFTDPGVTEGHRVTIQWDDPNSTADSVFEIGATNGTAQSGSPYTSTTAGDNTTLTVNSVNTTSGLVTFTVSHQYLDDGEADGNGTPNDNAHIQVTVEDFVGPDPVDFTVAPLSSGSNSKDVTINNIVPTVVVNPITSIVEAGSATVSGSFTDIGRLDDHTLTINWGDGTQSVFAVPAALTPLSAGGISQSSGVAATLTIGAGLNNNTGFVPYSVAHTYANNGLFTVQVTVADDDGGSNSGSSTVNVTNFVPTVAAPVAVPNPVVENSSVSLTGNFTDVGVSDSHTVTVNWADPNNPINSVFSLGATNTLSNAQTFNSTSGDGAVLTLTAAPTAGGLVTFSVASHLYRDDGSAPGNGSTFDVSNIAVAVTDSDNATGNAGVALTVNNAAPSIQNLAAAAINENDLATLTGQFTDVGLLDTHNVTVSWGDGTPNSTFSLGSTTSLTNGSGFISTSGDGATLTITSPPTAAGVVTFQVKHRYLDDPAGTGAGETFPIQVTVTDDDGGSSGIVATTVVVNNVAPSLSQPAPVTINENSTATLITTITDVGTLDTFSVDVDWKDPAGVVNTIPGLGSSNTSGTVGGATGTTFSWVANTRTLTLSHTYLDDNPTVTSSDTFAPTLIAHDDDGGNSALVTASVTVNDVAPTVLLNGVAAIQEVGTATLTGSFTDIGILDTHTITINWGDPNNANNSVFAVGATNGAGLSGSTITSTGADTTTTLHIDSVNTTTGLVTFTVSHKYVDDGLANATPPGANGTTSDQSTIQVSVIDDDSLSGSNSTIVTVNDVAPTFISLTGSTVTETADPIAPANLVTTLSGTFVDPGLSDAHTLTVNWGDPNNPTISSFPIKGIQTPAGATVIVLGVPIASTAGDSAVLTLNSFATPSGTVTFTITHRYADDGASTLAPLGGNTSPSDSSLVTATITDDDALSSQQNATVVVNNAPPSIDLVATGATLTFATFKILGSFTDVGLNDVHTIVITWGDATSSTFNISATSTLNPGVTTFTQTAGAASTLAITAVDLGTGKVNFSATHAYAAAGAVTINSTIADDDSSGAIADPSAVTVTTV